MFRLWQMYDPRGALIGLFVFLFVLALLIHAILLSSERYNFLADVGSAEPAGQVAPKID